MEVDGQSITKTLVKNRQGNAILTLGAIPEELRRGDLAAVSFEPKAEWMLGIADREEVAFSPTGPLLIDSVFDICKDLIESGAWPARYLGP